MPYIGGAMIHIERIYVWNEKEEMISYFWAISNPTRLRMRQIMERSE